MLAILAAGRSAAQAEPRPVAVAVDFAPPAAGPAWFSTGLAELTRRELSRFSGVTLADPIADARCPDHAMRCRVDAYREAGVALIVFGRVERRGLAYETWDTWTGARAYGGVVSLGDTHTATLERRIGEMIRPIVQRGGLADQRPTADAPETPAPATPTAPPTKAKPAPPPPPAPPPSPPLIAPRKLVPLVFLVLSLFIALPPLLARLLVRSHQLRKHVPPASWKWSAALAGSLGTLAVGTTLVDATALFDVPAPPALTLLLPLVSGTMWGALVLVLASWLLAPIHGLGHIRHDTLWSLLRSWMALVLLRGLALAACAPVVLVTLRLAAALSIPSPLTLGLLLPGAGLLFYFWFLTLVDNLALYLDVQLVVGPASARSPWHGTIKRYLRGYLRRHGVQVDTPLFERALFLPSLIGEVISYGGGFARPRILVGEAAREATFGGLPDEDEFPERSVNDEALPWGFVVPSALTRRELSPSAEPRRRALTRAPARPRAPLPRLVGESATLLGWVMPQPGGDGVPLIANTVEDYDVVKRLLTAHYSAFERNLDDDEVDDTDPTQKDFLFGALLRHLGVLMRRDGLLATLWYSVALASSRVGRFLARAPVWLYERLLSGPAARVADAYAALNHGLHPLIQYLAFRQGLDEARLTARADEPRLVALSRELVEVAEHERGERDLLRATPRNRMVWLSRFFHAPLAARSQRFARAIGVAAVVAVLAVIASLLVRDAIAYHPRYLEQVQSERDAK